MNLRDWLYINRITITKFAKSLSVTRDHMSGIINGKYNAGPRLARDIVSATNGEVTVEEFADEDRKEKI